jgi:hypothetical protein
MSGSGSNHCHEPMKRQKYPNDLTTATSTGPEAWTGTCSRRAGGCSPRSLTRGFE